MKTLISSTLLLAAAVLFGCRETPVEPVSETELRLGTTITVSIYQDPPDDAFERVFDRVLEIEEKMSTSTQDYESTEILEVNRADANTPIEVSPDTFHVVERGLEFSEISGGAFDITVAPLVQLWGIGTEGARVPDEEEIEATLPLIDYRRVRLYPERDAIGLAREGMGIDVGGIAKGYAADEAVRILAELGVDHALLDFGGNILTLGVKPDGSRWRIGIQNPDQTRGSYVGIVEIAEEAVVTSGPYERFFVKDGVRYHHILDTDDGYPVRNGLASVTIVTADSTAADALSTACYALGLEEGLTLVRSLDGVEGVFITDTNAVHITEGLTDRFTLSSAEFRLGEALAEQPSTDRDAAPQRR